MWALCHSPFVLEAETEMPPAEREKVVASDAPKLFGEDLDSSVSDNEKSFSTQSAGKGPMITMSPTATLPLKDGQCRSLLIHNKRGPGIAFDATETRSIS